MMTPLYILEAIILRKAHGAILRKIVKNFKLPILNLEF